MDLFRTQSILGVKDIENPDGLYERLFSKVVVWTPAGAEGLASGSIRCLRAHYR